MATKRKTQGVSLQPELLARALVRAGDKGFSGYVVELIEQDLSKRATLSPETPCPLGELSRVFYPSRQLFFKEEMGQFNHSLVIQRLLEATYEAVRRGEDFEPEAPFALYNSTDQLVAFLRQSSQKSKFDLIHGVVNDLIAAEDGGKYSAGTPEGETIKNLKKHASRAAHKPTPTPPKPKPTVQD